MNLKLLQGCLVLIFVCFAVLVFADDYEDYDEDDEDVSAINMTAVNGTIAFVRTPENRTVDAGVKVVKLICEVQDLEQINGTSPSGDGNRNKVTIKWTKHYGNIERSKKINYKTTKQGNKYTSVLRINNPELFDRAFYDCIASNGVDKIRAQALLEVGSDGRWGSTASLNGLSRSETEITTVSPNEGSVFHPTLGEMPKTHDLEEAIKTGKIQKTFDLTPAVARSIYNNTSSKSQEPLCQMYRGSACRDHLADKYVFVQPPNSQEDIESRLREAFVVISQSKDISSSCNKFAQPSLCYSAFPVCVDPKHINTYQMTKLKQLQKSSKNGGGGGLSFGDFRTIISELTPSLNRICKDDCMLLETELCSKEYAIAKRHPVIVKTLEMADCQFLPDETDESSKNCLSLGVDNESVNKEDNCYWDDGQSYRGIQNHTQTGNKCLRWAHQFHIAMSDHPELTGHNYCRNPSGLEPQPFCYVEQNRRELCSVNKCAHVFMLYAVGLFFGVSVTVAVIFGVLCCRRRGKTRNIQNINIPNADKNIYGNPGPNSPMEMNTLLPPNIPPQRHHHPAKGSGYQNVPQYTYKEVAFVEELGEGAFGKVYKGELKAKTGKIFVAVKSLKENASAKTQADFQREIELISELKHPNIICLMGVVVKQEPMCMLFEFMSEGDLHEFLIANSPSEGRSLTQNQFLHIAIQIAQGMEYLSENHYVHRDLAARNCLVSQDMVVKISDFGLSRDMYSCDYYRVQSKSLLPVRWMPPESILYGKFTTESDVWSYGVVLWEIYSYGLQPYYGYNNQEVINMIRSRKLLPCPDACPSYCYALMVECWAELAIRRPSFAEISHRLRVWKQNGSANGAYFKTPENHAAVLQQPPHLHHYPPLVPQTSAPSAAHRFTHHGSSKSSNSHAGSDSPTTVCPPMENQPSGVISILGDTTTPSATWERGLNKSQGSSCSRLNESQSSLTSRSSSLGNRTQSTNLSNTEQHHNAKNRKSSGGNQHHHHHHHNRSRHSSSNKEDSLSLDRPKNTVVSSNGDNFEIKITH